MQNGIIKGTGNSRYLKTVANFLALYPTYEDFAQAFIAGTLPVDLNGINTTGWQNVGDALNKENLLKDATAALYGLDATAVPDDVLSKLSAAAFLNAAKTAFTDVSGNNILTIPGTAKIATGSYTGTGTYGSSNPCTLRFNFSPKIVFIFSKSGRTMSGYYTGDFAILVYNCSRGVSFSGGNGTSTYGLMVTWQGTTCSWYFSDFDSSSVQLNTKNESYVYAAIG